jgi:protein SCO1/2
MRFGFARFGVIGKGLILMSVLAASPDAPAQVVGEKSDAPPNEGRYLYRALPDIGVRSESERTFRLSELWRERPILLTLVFTRCAGVCSPLLRSLKAAAEAVGGIGREYGVVVLSFDPRDTPSDMAELAEHLGVSGDRAWTFGVASVEDLVRLVRATGFWFEWEEASRQYDHPAMVIGIREGRIVRFLIGGAVSPVRLQEVVREMRGEFVRAYPLPRRDVLFRCFQYDPASGQWRPDWGFLLLLIPGMATIVSTVWIFRGGRAHRRARALGDREPVS